SVGFKGAGFLLLEHARTWWTSLVMVNAPDGIRTRAPGSTGRDHRPLDHRGSGRRQSPRANYAFPPSRRSSVGSRATIRTTATSPAESSNAVGIVVTGNTPAVARSAARSGRPTDRIAATANRKRARRSAPE